MTRKLAADIEQAAKQSSAPNLKPQSAIKVNMVPAMSKLHSKPEAAADELEGTRML